MPFDTPYIRLHRLSLKRTSTIANTVNSVRPTDCNPKLATYIHQATIISNKLVSDYPFFPFFPFIPLLPSPVLYSLPAESIPLPVRFFSVPTSFIFLSLPISPPLPSFRIPFLHAPFHPIHSLHCPALLSRPFPPPYTSFFPFHPPSFNSSSRFLHLL